MSDSNDIALLKADRDIIAQHYRRPGSIELGKRLAKTVARIDLCREIMLRPEVGPTRRRVIGQLVQEEGISEHQAEKIYTLTNYIHAKLPKGNRDFHVEYVLGRIQDQLEANTGNAKMYYQYLKLYTEVLDKFFSEEIPDIEEIRAKEIVVKYQPEILGIQEEENWRERAEKLRAEMEQKALSYGG